MPELPKLSGITKVLITPEASFEKMVKDATKFELPPGPQSVLTKVQASVEAGEVPKAEDIIPAAPKIELPKLPALPKIEGMLPGGEKTSGEEKPSEAEGYELEKEVPEAGYVMSR